MDRRDTGCSVPSWAHPMPQQAGSQHQEGCKIVIIYYNSHLPLDNLNTQWLFIFLTWIPKEPGSPQRKTSWKQFPFIVSFSYSALWNTSIAEKAFFHLHLQFILYHIWWFFRWKNTITTWHLTGMQLAIGMLIFNSLLYRQRAFWECQKNPHWEGMAVNWSILHWKGTKSSLLTCTLRQFLRDLMVSFLFVLNLNLWTAARLGVNL